MTEFSIDFKKSNLPENQGVTLYDRPLSDSIFEAVLLADTVTSLAVPVGATHAWIQATEDFFISSATFSLPTSNTFVENDVELNPPPLLRIDAITTLFFRAVGTPTITVAFYT